MKKNHISRYYEGQRAHFLDAYKKVRSRPEMEDIHQMRVGIKRLRATWTLFERLTRATWKKKTQFDLIRKLYKAAGNLREAQVNLDLLRAHRVSYLAGYKEQLQRSEPSLTRKLRQRARAFDLKAFNKQNKELLKKMSTVPRETVVQESAEFVLKTNKKIAKLKDKERTDATLHRIRIELKRVHEVLAIIKELNPKASLKTLQEEIKSLNTGIGLWHDYEILNSSLRSFEPKGTKSRRLKDYLDRQQARQSARRDKLYQRIDRYVAKQRLRQIENLF